MIGARWHKVFNDLVGNKTRTILIVLSIAVGLFAVGTIVSSHAILSAEMANSYAAIRPSTGTVRTLQLFDQGLLRSVRAMKGVQDADARRVLAVRTQLGPDRWANLTIFAVEDYAAIRVNKIWPYSGAWPPPVREILIERAALQVIGAQVGDSLLVEMPNEKRYRLRIAGLAHDLSQMPAQLDNSPYGYISFETLEWLGEPYGFNELHIVARPPEQAGVTPEEHASIVTNQVKNKVERNGLTIPLSLTSEPGQLPLDDILQAVLLLLGALGLLALFLSVFLIVNTVSALLAQQKRQIGVMKAVGARTGQVVGMYLGLVTIYGLAALGLAVPLGIAGARALSRFVASLFNFDLPSLNVPASSIVLQIAIGLLVPCLASLYPIVANLRLTAAQAMSTYQLGQASRSLPGASLWFARRALVRPWLLSLRNMFRSKGRLALTLATLALAGAIFVSVFSVRASLFDTIDGLMQMWNFDTWLSLSHPHRAETIQREAQRVPGVIQTDVWLQLSARRVRQDGSQGGAIFLFAPRPDSELARPPVLVQGRWLLPEDENALVVNAILLKDESDIQLGDEVVLKIEGRERRWRVVGVCLGVLFPMAYANYPYVAHVTGNAHQANAVLVATAGRDGPVNAALEAQLDQAGLRVVNVQTMAAERAETETTFGIIVSLLLIMAALLAVVGGLGLMGTMSINVLERTREIGVLRAIGASNRGVAWVFIREGIAIGVLSWVFGSLLGFPLSKLLSNAIGVPVMGVPLTFSYSMAGVWIWLGVVVILSGLASFLPARGASRLTVREVLAYE